MQSLKELIQKESKKITLLIIFFLMIIVTFFNCITAKKRSKLYSTNDFLSYWTNFKWKSKRFK